MRFKFIVISVILLIAAYSFFWFQMADKAKQTTLDWIENSESRLGGIKTYVGDIAVSGFPYRIVIEASSLNALVPEGRFGADQMSINIPEVAVIYQPWEPTHAIIITDYFDVVVGSLHSPIRNISLDKVKSSVILDPSTMRLNNLSIVADKVSWFSGAQKEAGEGSQIEMAEFHIRRPVSEAAEQMSYDLPVNSAVYFKGQNAIIKELASTVLGERADQFKVEALLHANEKPDFTKLSLAKWRDEGGTLSIKSFEYGTSSAGINLTGDVTLDENLKPLGAFDANILGIAELLETLSENEELSEATRLMLKGQAQNETMPGEVPLSISMQNGMLYLGPIMLMELPAIVE